MRALSSVLHVSNCQSCGKNHDIEFSYVEPAIGNYWNLVGTCSNTGEPVYIHVDFLETVAEAGGKSTE